MLILNRHLRQIGFTLVELLIVIAIVGIMASVAMPAFQQWVQSAKIRTVAEALQNGVRLAQVESLRRGTPVHFFITSATPDATATISATSTTGSNWVICTANTTGTSSACNTFVQGGNMAGTATNITVTATGTNGLITFNSIGRVVSYAGSVPSAAAGRSFQVRSSTTGTRKLDVQVSPSGSVRMCDADKARSSTDPDGCA